MKINSKSITRVMLLMETEKGSFVSLDDIFKFTQVNNLKFDYKGNLIEN